MLIGKRRAFLVCLTSLLGVTGAVLIVTLATRRTGPALQLLCEEEEPQERRFPLQMLTSA